MRYITKELVLQVNDDGTPVLDEDGKVIEQRSTIREYVPFSSTGNKVDLVESLPNSQVVITPNDSTVVDLMGLECLVSGTVAVKFTNDAVAFTRTVVAGQIIYGRIVAVMATGTSLVQAELIGLK